MQAQGHARLRSGAPYDNVYCLVFRFADGAAREVTEYLDTGLVQRAFGVPPTAAQLLRAMDLNCWEMYRQIARGAAGSEVLDTPLYTLTWTPRGTPFHNARSCAAPIALDELLDASRRFHGARRVPATVWVRAHADQALEADLRARGYATFTTMPGMALLGDPGTVCAPEGLTIRARRRIARACDDFRHVSAEAYATYGAPPEYADDAFADIESVCAPHIQGFVGYADGAAVAAAALYLTHGVAGIGWVGCVPSARGRRYAEALTWRAVREGFRRGASFANLQASPMGRPVYERMGFATPTEYRVLFAPPSLKYLGRQGRGRPVVAWRPWRLATRKTARAAQGPRVRERGGASVFGRPPSKSPPAAGTRATSHLVRRGTCLAVPPRADGDPSRARRRRPGEPPSPPRARC